MLNNLTYFFHYDLKININYNLRWYTILLFQEKLLLKYTYCKNVIIGVEIQTRLGYDFIFNQIVC